MLDARAGLQDCDGHHEIGGENEAFVPVDA
jgi:hypothetical protein